MCTRTWSAIQFVGLTSDAPDYESFTITHSPMYAKFKACGSQVLEAAQLIEGRLEVLLCHPLVGTAQQREHLFRSLALDLGSGSIFPKYLMLRKAFEPPGRVW